MKCESCRHYQPLSYTKTNIACLYILNKRKARGCPPGDACDKYEPREADKPKVDLILNRARWRRGE